MFAELIFVLLAIFGLLLLDNFSTSLALITCMVAVYYYVDYFPFVLNKYVIVFVAAKIWATLTSCYCVGKKSFHLFKKILTFKKIPVPPPIVSTQFCEYEGGVEHEIKILVSKVSQYYIHSWYDKISSNEQFVSYLNSSINDTLVSLCTSITKVNKKKFSYVILQIYLNFFTHFVEAKKKSEVFKKENFKMKHWAMKDRVTEWCYLQSLVSTLLDSFCPSECERSLHSKYSPVLHSVVVEILTENLIHPLVNLLCNPTRLNLMLLKALLIYVDTNSDRTFPSVNKSSYKDPSSPPTKDCKNKTTMSLSNEMLSNNHVRENSTKLKSKNFLSVPDSSTLNQIQKNTSKFFIEQSNESSVTDNSSSFFSSGIKSSSNINISDHNFHNDLVTLDCDSYPSFACDTTIKRSRSADYIRQIKPVCANSQLKALNEKDYNIILQSETNKMVIALKLDTNSGNSIEEAEEAFEFEGQTLFTDIKITDTFLQNEAGLIPYTLYCIQYIGVFHDTGNSTDTPHLVKKVICIKRRFKEFVELHSKIEENPSLKNYVKKIKGPNKWLILPFSNLDKKNIADRKIFLENYLKELCSSIPIARSSELHKFLAYGDAEKIPYARKSTDASVPRIDKILVRGVKSAFDMFKTAVPLEEDVFSSETVLDDDPDLKFQEHLLDVCNREPEIDEHARNFLENSSFQLSSEDFKITEPYPKSLSFRSIHLKSTGCCRCLPLPENRFYEEKYPLANTIFELIAVAFKLNETTTGDVSSVLKLACFNIVKLMCSPNIDRFFSSKIDVISEEHLTACFHMLHKYLWPDEKCLNQPKESVEDEANLNKIMEYMKAILSTQSIIPNANFAVQGILLEKINLFLSSIQHQETNRCLLYHVFDVIVETLCSNET